MLAGILTKLQNPRLFCHEEFVFPTKYEQFLLSVHIFFHQYCKCYGHAVSSGVSWCGFKVEFGLRSRLVKLHSKSRCHSVTAFGDLSRFACKVWEPSRCGCTPPGSEGFQEGKRCEERIRTTIADRKREAPKQPGRRKG